MRLPNPAKWKYRNECLAFALPFLCMTVLMLVNGYTPFGTKKSMLYSDMYHQYYPFFVEFRRTLRSGGSLVYNWHIGMGVDYLGLIAYYLGSPLNLLSVLVPDSFVLGYFSLLMPLKLGFAGLFEAIFLKHIFRRDKPSIALFGGFYALCAWALGYQWNVMWLDTFALLPLVALGMVQLLRDRKILLYTLSLWLAVFANYYIGLFVCIFVFLAFFCYEIVAAPGWKRFFADLGTIAVCSILAIGMTAVLSYSSVMGLQSTQSSVNKFPDSFRLNMTTDHTFLGLLGAMRRVAGNMGGGLEPTFKEGLPNLYCGVGTIILGFLFLISEDVKLREKLCCAFLLVFFNVSFIIRQLDYIWHGFHFTNMIPYRFSFLHSFVLVYMAYRAWTLRRRFDCLLVLSAGFLTAAVLACSENLMDTLELRLFGQTVILYKYIVYNLSFLLLYEGFLLYGAWKPRAGEDRLEARVRLIRHRITCRYLCLILAAAELITTVCCFGCYFPATGISNYPKGTQEAASMFRYLQERTEREPFARTEVTHTQTLNDDALNGYSGITAFTSSANVHITLFLQALGYGAKNTYNRYAFEESSPVANLFLNLKYMLDRDGKDKESSVFSQVHHYGRVSLLKNNAYLPLGFVAEQELADVDFLNPGQPFAFQNGLFRAATGLSGDVWHRLRGDNLEILGNAVELSNQNGMGYVHYSDCESGSTITYYYSADRDGFACIHLDCPKRNTFCVNVNEEELYQETISLPQMLAVKDVQKGDIISVRIACEAGESSSMNVTAAILDNDLFFRGYDRLAENTLEITRFADTQVDGVVNTQRDGLLYTSIPQNGNWHAYLDGKEAEITLVGDCMVSLPVTAGTHTVRFIYQNTSFHLGLEISLACGVLLVLLCLRKRRKA